MNPQKIINIFLLFLVLIVTEKCFSQGDDLDDVVRCKHCGHSLPLCSHLKSCKRYIPDIEQAPCSTKKKKDEKESKYKWIRGHGVLDIVTGSAIAVEPFLFSPRNKILNLVERLELSQYLVDFIQATSTESMVNKDIIEEETGTTIEGGMDITGEDTAVTIQQPVEIIEVNSEGVDIFFESEELLVQDSSAVSEAVKLGDNPVFIHFEQHMVILDYTFPGHLIASLLQHLNIPEGAALEQVVSVASNTLSGGGGQISTSESQVDLGGQNLSDGAYLLLVQDRETREWFKAIVIIHDKHALLFLLDEGGSLETLVSSRKIFREGVKNLAGVVQKIAGFVEGISEFEVFLYPLEFPAGPILDAVTLDMAVEEHKAQKEESEMDMDVAMVLGVNPPMPPALSDQIDTMESMTVSWGAGLVPEIFSGVPVCAAKPAEEVSHTKGVHCMLKKQFTLLIKTPANFSGSITSEALFDIVQEVTNGNLIVLDMLQAMLMSIGITLQELPSDYKIVNDTFLVVIHSEDELEPPSILFININQLQTMIWEVSALDSVATWNIFSGATPSLLEIFGNLSLCKIDIYKLN